MTAMGKCTITAVAGLLTAALLALAGCSGERPGEAAPSANPSPTETVHLLTAHLRDNDLEAFARDAVTPQVHGALETAWREGRTRWPLDQLPFSRHLPRTMAALSAPDGERKLQQAFDRQLANASLAHAAEFLTVFTVQYILQQGEFSVSEREHYPQLAQAIGRWAMQAPIGDRARAQATLAAMSAAAREAALDTDQAFVDAGMSDSLARMSRVLATGKQVLASYGFDLDGDLAGMQVQLQSQTGDLARVRMQYALAGSPIDTVVQLERREGRWYVSDFLRHAETAAAGTAESDR